MFKKRRKSGQASAGERSPGRSLCLTKSSACGRPGAPQEEAGLTRKFETSHVGVKVKSESEATQSCPTFSDPMDCSPPGSSVRGISHIRIPEWVVISFSRGSSDPGIEPQSPALAGRFFTSRKQSSLSGKESAQGCVPQRLLGRPD